MIRPNHLLIIIDYLSTVKNSTQKMKKKYTFFTYESKMIIYQDIPSQYLTLIQTDTDKEAREQS